MLEIKRSVNIENGIINDCDIYIDSSLISEGIIPYKENDLFGFKDSKGNIIIKAKYTDVKPFENGLAWVFNEYSVPVLINKKGEELSYEPNYLYDFSKLEKKKDNYLKENKTFAKKNKFYYDEKYKVYEENYLFGLKDLNKNIILPAEYYQIICHDGVLIIDGELYNINEFKVIYTVNLSYKNSSLTKTFYTYEEMEMYIKKFSEIFKNKIILLHEDILEQIFNIRKKQELHNENILNILLLYEEKEKNEVLNIFKDADKKANKIIKKVDIS